MSEISQETDTFLLNYSYLFWGSPFYGTQCSSLFLSYKFNVTPVQNKTV